MKPTPERTDSAQSERHSWTREEIETVWDVFADAGLEYARESMYYDEGADSEFCEKHRQRIAGLLDDAGLVPAAGETP